MSTSGSASCLLSPVRREIPAASSSASSLAWVSGSTGSEGRAGAPGGGECGAQVRGGRGRPKNSGSGECGGARERRNSGSGSASEPVPDTPSSIRKESTYNTILLYKTLVYETRIRSQL